MAKRGTNPALILKKPNKYENEWVVEPKPASHRFIHFVHENVRKEEGYKRAIGAKDKKNGFNNRLEQFFSTHCME